jgi:hypothetical protein
MSTKASNYDPEATHPSECEFVMPQEDSESSHSFVEAIAMTVFPNPANEHVTLNVDVDVADVVIHDSMGRVVISVMVSNGVSTIDLTTLSNGTYNVVATSKSTQTHKVLVIAH